MRTFRSKRATARWLILASLAMLTALSLFFVSRAGAAMSDVISVSVWIGEAIEDTDDDGIGDGWEIEYFGGLGVATATSDYDGDGSPDLHEFLAGTHPKDPASLLRIEGIEFVSGNMIRVTWQSSTNLVPSVRRYDVYGADTMEDLEKGGTLVLQDVVSQGENTAADHGAGNDTKFYRIQLR